MNGIISNGNYAFSGSARDGAPPAIELTGDTTITGGLWICARINRNGYDLTITGGNTRGLWVNGVKQNAVAGGMVRGTWGSGGDNVEGNAGNIVNFKLLGELASAKAILDTLAERGGRDAIESWASAIDIIHDGDPTMTWAEFVAEYSAQSSADNLAYSGGLFKRAANYLGLSTWAEFRDWVNGLTADQLTGAPTETVEEVA